MKIACGRGIDSQAMDNGAGSHALRGGGPNILVTDIQEQMKVETRGDSKGGEAMVRSQWGLRVTGPRGPAGPDLKC